jgi:hypothetical protein
MRLCEFTRGHLELQAVRKSALRAAPVLVLLMIVAASFLFRTRSCKEGVPLETAHPSSVGARSDDRKGTARGPVSTPSFARSQEPRSEAQPDWVVATTIDFNDTFRRERLRRSSSIGLEWCYIDRYANDGGSLSSGSKEHWLQSYAGQVYDQIHGGPGGYAGDRRTYRLERMNTDTTVLRREMTPISLWLLANLKKGTQADLSAQDLAVRIRSNLVLRAYSPRPQQPMRPRDLAPDTFKSGDGEYQNTSKRWLPEMGGPGVLFDATNLLTLRIANVFPMDQEEIGRHHPNANYHHAPIQIETIAAPLSSDSSLFFQIELNVAWDRLPEYPALVAVQPFLDVGGLGIPGLGGHAFPEPKDILLAETRTGEDAYRSMLSRALSFEVLGDMDRFRSECERVLARWPRALEPYEQMERSYRGTRDYAGWAALCTRAIQTCTNPDPENVIGWDPDLAGLPRPERVARLKTVADRALVRWQKKLEEVHADAKGPQPPK